MRPLTAALLVALAAACAPSEQPPADTAVVPVGAATDSAATDSAARAVGAAGTTGTSGATATPLPTPAPTPARSGAAGTRETPRTAGTTPVARGAATDTSTGPRLRPPSKAPGGYIIVPNSAHDSLRMAPRPGTTTGTSTRP